MMNRTLFALLILTLLAGCSNRRLHSRRLTGRQSAYSAVSMSNGSGHRLEERTVVVTDTQTHEPLDGAVVLVEHQLSFRRISIGLTEDGKFVFKLPTNAKIRIFVLHAGFKTEVWAEPHCPSEIHIPLTPHLHNRERQFHVDGR